MLDLALRKMLLTSNGAVSKLKISDMQNDDLLSEEGSSNKKSCCIITI